MDFEWDDAKAAANLRKHAISFEDAQDVFADPFALFIEDDRFRYDEFRFVAIGAAQLRILTVVYIERYGRIRIISAREAEPYERRLYHEGSSRS